METKGPTTPIQVGITSALINVEQPLPSLSLHGVLLEKAGAQPVILRKDTDPNSVISGYDLCGMIFSGGGDISPSRYGGKADFAKGVDEQRDAFEFALMERAFEADIPILAICRGMQLANVFLGGTLIEDLPYELQSRYCLAHHQSDDAGLGPDAYAHDIHVARKSMLQETLGTTQCKVNSFHHQAIHTLAPKLKAVAWSDDEVIEAVEYDGYQFFLGVQWHPENIYWDRFSAKLYASFVQACLNWKKQKTSSEKLEVPG